MALNELAARADALDFDVCDNLQLSPTQHQKAEDRYRAIAKVISAANSPFSRWDSNLYPSSDWLFRPDSFPMDKES
jgi:hypothetical protein